MTERKGDKGCYVFLYNKNNNTFFPVNYLIASNLEVICDCCGNTFRT